MNQKKIRDKTLAALLEVAPEADPAAIKGGVNFRDQLDIDSIDYLNFVLNLEKSFSLRIPGADYPKLSCLDGCISYFESSLNP